MDSLLEFLRFISELLNDIEFIKGFVLGGICGAVGMVSWRRRRIKELIEDRERDREYFAQEIERLKKENANLILKESARHYKP